MREKKTKYVETYVPRANHTTWYLSIRVVKVNENNI